MKIWRKIVFIPQIQLDIHPTHKNTLYPVFAKCIKIYLSLSFRDPKEPIQCFIIIVQFRLSVFSPSESARNLGVMIDDQLSLLTTLHLSPNLSDLLCVTSGTSNLIYQTIQLSSWTSHFSSYNLTIISPYRTPWAVKPLQMIQNETACLISAEIFSFYTLPHLFSLASW